MTFNLSSPPVGSRTQFDSGPLSWVMGEIRAALNQSRTALLNASGKDSETSATLLNHAGAYLHQAHGALQIVDVDGVIIITEAIEDILRRIGAEEITLTHTNRRIIEQAYQAINEYLEELLSGEPQQPIKLFPYYKDLQKIRGQKESTLPICFSLIWKHGRNMHRLRPLFLTTRRSVSIFWICVRALSDHCSRF